MRQARGAVGSPRAMRDELLKTQGGVERGIARAKARAKARGGKQLWGGCGCRPSSQDAARYLRRNASAVAARQTRPRVTCLTVSCFRYCVHAQMWRDGLERDSARLPAPGVLAAGGSPTTLDGGDLPAPGDCCAHLHAPLAPPPTSLSPTGPLPPPPCAAEVFALDSAHRVDGKAACLRVRTCVVQARTQGRAGQGRACCWLPAPACRRLCTDARVCVLSRHACRVYARAPPTDPVPRGQLWPTGSVGAGHRVSRPRGTGSVGDSVGEGRRLREMLLLRPCGDAAAGIRWSRCCQDRGNA